MLNPTLKRDWIAALRSGTYLQCTADLCRVRKDGAVGYCCLGVLLDLAIQRGSPYIKSVIPAAKVDERAATYKTPDGNYCSLFLENEKDIGLAYKHGKRFSEENDEGKSFTEIADMIEADPTV